MKPWLGIDIGTTYTRACIWDPSTDEITNVKCENGETKLITRVAFENGKAIFGPDAAYHCHRVRDSKLLIGKHYSDERV